MKKGKIDIISILFLLVSLCFVSSCTSRIYQGKDIANIEYRTVDYFGGYTKEHIVDLENMQVRSRGYMPQEEKPTFLVEATFTKEKVSAFVNKIYQAGLLDIEETYPSPGGIADGSGWQLKICYVDGSIKYSSGDNNGPTAIFQKADYAFYELYGNDLFGTLPHSYRYPPTLDIAYKYTFEKHTYSEATALGVTNYTWNQSQKNGIDNITYALSKSYGLDSQYNWSFVLWTANLEYRFKQLEIYTYDENGENQQLLLQTKWFEQKEFPLEHDKVYVIRVEYSQGICEYAFSTHYVIILYD